MGIECVSLSAMLIYNYVSSLNHSLPFAILLHPSLTGKVIYKSTYLVDGL